MNSRPFCGRQTSENVVFCEWGDFGYMRILHSSAVLGRTSPTKYSQGFLELPRDGQKTGKSQGFCGCLRCVVLLFHFVSSWSPVVLIYLLVCKCFIRPCILILAVMLFFLRWFCFLVSIRLYLCCALYFAFGYFSLLSSLLVWQKPRSNHKISQILIVIFCFGACIPTLSLGPDNTLLGQEKNSSKNVFCCLASWSISNVLKYLFLLCFTHHPKLAYKMGPNKNDNVSQNAKQESVFQKGPS